MPTAVERLANEVSNELPGITPRYITGIIGDRPSQYAKTPPLWNAVFRELGWDAVSLPWDLPDDRLSGFLNTVRETAEVLGFSVTQPFKVAIVDRLDALDPLAERIGAVNTVVRRRDGALVGFNTDGQGAIDALTAAMPGSRGPLFDDLRNRDLLLIGAGGAARAVAFFLADRMAGQGRLRIVNRDAAKASELAQAVRKASGVGEGGTEQELADWIPQADLVVNASVKGQSGWRRTPAGEAFTLEPYSALAPADPARLSSDRQLDEAASRDWFVRSRESIDRNNALGRAAVAGLRPGAACFDLVYAPLESRFLTDARYAGHVTMNGKWMNVGQAADAFARKVCLPILEEAGTGIEEGYRRAFEVMARVW